MLRKIHAWPGLIAGVLVAFMALTGAILALEPVLAAASAGGMSSSGDLATLAAGTAANIDAVQRIVRLASGDLVAYALSSDGPVAMLVDAAGNVVAPYEPSAFFQFVTELHRAFLAGDSGRMLAGLTAAALGVLSLGGVLLLAKRLGGWRKFFSSARGTLSQRLHVELSRIGVIVLTVLSVTGLWMTLSFFGLVGAETGFSFPPESAGTAAMDTSAMPALKAIALADLRELVFPASGDLYDVYSVTTASGSGFIDQSSGTLLSFAPNSAWENVYQLVYTLHTGQGLGWYALLIGLAALTIPVLFVTGLVIWFMRSRKTVRLPGNARSGEADTVVLVGSEGNSTWGFAKTLHEQLVAAGHRVHTAPMNDLARHYPKARHLIVMSATYGDSDAPESARRFLDKLARFAPPPGLDFAVLGFGDRSFADFCGYAVRVKAALSDKGLVPIVDYTTIDRQSAQSFAEWGQALGTVLGQPLTLHHTIELPKTQRFVLESRRDFGEAYQTPRAILRFRPLARPGFIARLGLTRSYAAGDLIGIVPPDSAIPRYYSLASAADDGFVEICVSKQPGGQCSTYLCALEPGMEIAGFFKPNPDFHAPRGTKPLIMIGAGTGIAPFIGHLRANRHRRPAYLYWGGRDPGSDFLYREELLDFRMDGRLSGARVSFSRAAMRRYVQEELREDGDFLRDSVKKGASILVCGGKSMARGVSEALDEVLAPLGIDSTALKKAGRLAEDVY